MRAVFEIRIQRLATGSADICTFMRLPVEIRPGPVGGLLTAVAHDKWFSLFDSEYRNKKQAEIMIRALVIRLI